MASVFQLAIVRGIDLPAMIAQAIAGDDRTMKLLLAAMRFVKAVETASPEESRQCAKCGADLRGLTFAVCLTCPVFEPLEGADWIFGICPECAPDGSQAGIKAAAVHALQPFCGDIRDIHVHGEGLA